MQTFARGIFPVGNCVPSAESPTNMRDDLATPAALRWWTLLTAASTLFLIFAGAMVTSTGSGLAVPDWPLSYGKVNPPMVGGIFYEHGHRVIATFVGFFTLVQAFWLQKREPKRFLRILGWVALATVVVQGIFGGITVLLLLPPAVSVTHAALAELFLALTVAIAFFAQPWFERQRSIPPAGSSGRAGAKILVVAIYLQILIGAWMRHIGAGLAIPDFPLSFGRLVPPLDSIGLITAYAHRVGGFVIALVVLVLARRALRSGSRFESRAMIVLLVGIVVQILLGATTIWTGREPVVTSLHVVTGALLLATSVAYALGVHARPAPGLASDARLERGDVTA